MKDRFIPEGRLINEIETKLKLGIGFSVVRVGNAEALLIRERIKAGPVHRESLINSLKMADVWAWQKEGIGERDFISLQKRYQKPWTDYDFPWKLHQDGFGVLLRWLKEYPSIVIGRRAEEVMRTGKRLGYRIEDYYILDNPGKITAAENYLQKKKNYKLALLSSDIGTSLLLASSIGKGQNKVVLDLGLAMDDLMEKGGSFSVRYL